MCRCRICQEYELSATKTTCVACDVFETECRKAGAQGQERKTELWICGQLRAQAEVEREEATALLPCLSPSAGLGDGLVKPRQTRFLMVQKRDEEVSVSLKT